MATANHVLLRRTTLTATAASVTLDLTGVSGYTDLKIVISGRDSSSAGTSGNGYSFTIYPNGLSTNITQRSLFGGSPVGVGSFNDTQMYNVAQMNADTANTYSNVEIYVPNYTSANPKSFSIDGVTENNGASAAIRLSAGLWNSTAAITSLQFNAYSTWMAGSSFAVYGIANAATTPLTAPKADGGDIIKTDGTYWYHAFLSTGSFKPQLNLTADVLVVAGGGGGGSHFGGGGGAGGLLGFTSQALASTSTYTCTVGAGGAGGVYGGVRRGSSGSNSQFGSLTTVIGGGGGGSRDGGLGAGLSGGSGGGGTEAGAGGAATSGQGYAGGLGSNSAPAYCGAGGGGATAVGVDGTGTVSGNGGAGSSAYSTWASATGTGSSSAYAGGGGGGTGVGGYTQGTGGTGGGGNGGGTNAGVANTGGGGGGFASAGTGGAGGSGIIIIRYPI